MEVENYEAARRTWRDLSVSKWIKNTPHEYVLWIDILNQISAGQYQDVYNITDIDLLQRSIAEYKQKQNEVKILNIGTDFNDT